MESTIPINHCKLSNEPVINSSYNTDSHLSITAMHRMIARKDIETWKAEEKLNKAKNKEVLGQLSTQIQLYLSSQYSKNSLNHLFTTDI